ncbi:MAG: sugar ABC transporter substrate-binding protein [Bacilli bacterium]|nr:sugar ABC transporter substrate-binding protein [Bacilli bacterium]
MNAKKTLRTLVGVCLMVSYLGACSIGTHLDSSANSTVGNSSTSGVTSISNVTSDLSSEDLDELEKIQAKYDASLYQYDGEECTLSMSHWDSDGAKVERAVVEAALAGFEKRYPKIHVNLDIIQNYETVYGNYLAAGTAHDVFLVPDGDFAAWAPSGKLMNLTPYINASELLTFNDQDIYSSCLSRYQYNSSTGRAGSGNQLSLPKDIGPQVMYYNKDWFDAKGVAYPPNDRIMTMDEATTMWKNLTKYSTDNKITGYGVAGLGIEGLVWSGGGDFLNPDRTAFPTDQATVAGLRQGYQYMKDAYLTNKIMPPSEFKGLLDDSTLFTQQKVATVCAGRWQVASFRSLSFNWDVAYIPGFTAAPTKNMWSGSVGYSVYSKCAHKEAAWKLVEYIASKEGQEVLSSTGFQIPVYHSLAEDASFKAGEIAKGPENYEVFVQSAINQLPGLWMYRANQLWKVNGYDVPSEYLFSSDPSTEITVDQFLETAKQKVNENLG